MNVKEKVTIGRSEKVSLPELGVKNIPARIDTGATITSVWASSIRESEQGLSFILFDEGSEFFTGSSVTIADYGRRVVSSSMGHVEVRYTVQLLVSLRGRRIRARVTLADRSTQTYPILIGRNILRNKYIVDVASGDLLSAKEAQRRRELDSKLEGGE
ncbi:hypothetical protein GW746_02545 [Candidatus Saccharibacteria bacterium]|nr:hypothetical protein [Candidatus Saccharibacteria bacterium]NCS83272.1 hypothetical protein [Candidatus Saccharibacteria bacterium]